MQIPIELNKKLGDYAIELIRDKLKDLAWLDEVYPAVKVGERLNGSTYPAIYAQKTHSKIFDLTPNSKLKSYIFFEKNGYEIEADSNIYDCMEVTVREPWTVSLQKHLWIIIFAGVITISAVIGRTIFIKFKTEKEIMEKRKKEIIDRINKIIKGK